MFTKSPLFVAGQRDVIIIHKMFKIPLVMRPCRASWTCRMINVRRSSKYYNNTLTSSQDNNQTRGPLFDIHKLQGSNTFFTQWRSRVLRTRERSWSTQTGLLIFRKDSVSLSWQLGHTSHLTAGRSVWWPAPPLRTELSPDHHYLSLCLFALIWSRQTLIAADENC